MPLATSRTFQLATILTPNDPRDDCSDSLRQNIAQAIWGCGTSGDAVDGDPNTIGYDCIDDAYVDSGITLLQMPDLVVSAITPTISCILPDGTFSGSIDVTVQNDGDGATLNDFQVSVTVTDAGGGTWTGSGTYSGTLAAGATAVISIDTTGWTPDCNDCRPYTLEATVDSGDTVCECNETNNSFTDTYIAPVPKLVLTAVTPRPSCTGESFIDVTVENQGCSDIGPGVVIVVTLNGVNYTGITGSTLAAGGGSETVTISLGTLPCDQSYTGSATVDPGDLICECNNTDHTLPASFELPCCSIDLEKATNGVDADSPTGPNIPVGDLVTWTYVVTNTGSTDIDNINVTDNQGVAVSCPNTTLAAGASMDCTASATVVTTMGDQYSNIGDVTGDPTFGGSPIGDPLTDTDPSHFWVENPSIDIEKNTNGVDADSPTGPYIPVGDPVNWTYVVTNTGNVTLTNITLTDDQGVAVFCSSNTLAAGAGMTCRASGTTAAGQYANIGTVTGSPPVANPVTDTDPSHYYGYTTELELEKSTNGEDADSPTGPYIPVGDPVNWTYVVTNPGNVDLIDVALTDDILGPVTCPSTTLAAGASMTCTASGTAAAGQYANIGTVTGTAVDDGGNPLPNQPPPATDPSHYYGYTTAIELEKHTNGVDADLPTGPYIPVGNPVTWTYAITNPGNVDLIDVALTDDILGPVTCPSTTLAAGASMTCTVTGTAAAGQYANEGTVTGTAVDDGGTPLPIQPPPATDPSHYYGYTTELELEKSTNGEDADSPTGPYIPVGDPVTWTYEVTNPGNVDLINVALTDNILGTVTCPSTTLAAGANMTCTASGTAAAGQYANLGTVTGTAIDDGGTPLPIQPPPATDPSHYYGYTTAIELEKHTNGVDADLPTGPYIPFGDPVTWTYEVTNPGNVDLIDVALTDDILGPVTCPSTTLAAGAGMTCTVTGTAAEGQYANVATVTGTAVDVGGNPLPNQPGPATDPSHYFGQGPSIDIEKSTNGDDADNPSGPYILVGDPVTWEYVVENTGNVTLTDVTVVDDRGVSVSCPPEINPLDPSEIVTCTATGTSVGGQYENNGTASGQPPVSNRVEDRDPSHYLGPLPGIDLEKATNGQDADTPTGPYIPIGDQVTWTYVITNNGNTYLGGFSLKDDQLGDISNSCQEGAIPNIPPGGSFTCSVYGTAVAGQYENNAEVTGSVIDSQGNPAGMNPVKDQDPSHYYGSSPSIDIEKATNGQDADFPTGPEISEGKPVQWSYVVTNTGNLILTDIKVTDSQGVAVSCPGTTLDPGQSMTCTASGIAITGQYRNDATVTGKPPVGPAVMDEDPSHYYGKDVPDDDGGDGGDITPPTPPIPPTPPMPPPGPTLTGRVHYEDCCLSVEKKLLSFQPPVDAVVVEQDYYFNTHMAMFGAYQLAKLRELHIPEEKLLNYKVSDVRNRIIEQTARYSSMNIGNLSTRSGLGIGMEFSPEISGSTRKERREDVQRKLAAIAAESGWTGDVKEIAPLLFEYVGAVPIRSDKNRGRWDGGRMDVQLHSGTLGMTMLAQARELRRLQASDDSRDRFLARVLTWQLEQKVAILADWLKKQPEGGQFFPHFFAKNTGESLVLTRADDHVYLADQASILWGLAELKNALAAAQSGSLKQVEELLEIARQNMDSLFDESLGTWRPEQLQDEPEAQNSFRIPVFDLFLATMASDAAMKTGGSWLNSGRYSERIKDTVAFMQQRVGQDGGLDKILDSNEKESSEHMTSLLATTAMARMELLAGEKSSALKRYETLDKLLWDDAFQVYRPDSTFHYQAEYDPYILGTFVDLLCTLTADNNIDGASVNRGLAFIDRILTQAGLQLGSEGALSRQQLPVVSERIEEVKPLIRSDRDDRNEIPWNVALQAQVLIRQVTLNLFSLKDLPDDMTTILEHQQKDAENRGYSPPPQFLTRKSERKVNTQSAALASVYLAETSSRLKLLSKETENPYLQDPVGVADLADAGDSIWKNTLISIGLLYDQGIPLAYGSGEDLDKKEPLAAFKKRLHNLEGKYFGDSSLVLSNPLFLEYLQGEPSLADKSSGWSVRARNRVMSLTGLGQVERSWITLMQSLSADEGAEDSQISEMNRFLLDLLNRQVEAKLDFMIDHLQKSERQGHHLLPERFRMAQDSRELPLGTEFVSEDVSLVGQLSQLLAFADILALYSSSEHVSFDNDDLLPVLEAAYPRLVRRVATAYGSDSHIEDSGENLVLEKGLALDLLGQLYQHPTTSGEQKKLLTPLIRERTRAISDLFQSGAGIGQLKKLGDIDREYNHLAAYSSVLLALNRVQQSGLEPDLSKIIAQLTRDFDKTFWHEKSGGYVGGVTNYDSREMRVRNHVYSELDIILPLAALTRSLEYLDPQEMQRLLARCNSFAGNVLLNRQRTTSVLTSSTMEIQAFDSAVLQNVDLQQLDFSQPHGGDLLKYRIRVYNRCPSGQAPNMFDSVQVRDFLPGNVTYVPGTTRIDRAWSDDPGSSSETLSWELDDVQGSSEIDFSVLIDPDLSDGQLINKVEAVGILGSDLRQRRCEFGYETQSSLGAGNAAIRVRYFEDKNLNRVQDESEPGVQGIPTYLRGEKSEGIDTSGGAGDSEFRNLTPGIYTLGPDWDEIQENIMVIDQTPVQVTVPESGEIKVDIALIQYRKITGWIFIDKNNNGRKDSNEDGIAGLRVQLKADSRYYAYSARDGFFHIRNIPASLDTTVKFSKEQPYARDTETIRPVIELTR